MAFALLVEFKLYIFLELEIVNCDSNTKMASEEGKKRRPGRPPTKPPAPPIEQNGIINTPSNENNRLEFVYSEPNVFKSLFTYFKNIRAREIHMRCTKKGITFFTRDHSKTSRIVADINGAYVNRYYCEEEFITGINREQVEKIFASIDKTFFKIVILQSKDDTGSLTIMFKDIDADKECIYKISLASYQPDEDLYDAEISLNPENFDHLYPVSFTLTAKLFKKTVNDTSGYSETITFEKIGNHPLQIVYNKSSITYVEVYISQDRIKLKSSIHDNEIFRSTIKLSNIKSLASSMVTDDVRIMCSENSDMLFRSDMDSKALVVSTLTRLN